MNIRKFPLMLATACMTMPEEQQPGRERKQNGRCRVHNAARSDVSIHLRRHQHRATAATCFIVILAQSAATARALALGRHAANLDRAALPSTVANGILQLNDALAGSLEFLAGGIDGKPSPVRGDPRALLAALELSLHASADTIGKVSATHAEIEMALYRALALNVEGLCASAGQTKA